MFKRQECSPSEQNNQYSCLDDDIIIDVAKILDRQERSFCSKGKLFQKKAGRQYVRIKKNIFQSLSVV